MLDNGDFYTTNFDLNNHYEQNILRMEKFDSEKVWTAVLWDADNQGLPYIKRFNIEPSAKHQNMLGDNPDSRLILLTDTDNPRLVLTFAEPDTFRGPAELDVDEFIAVKGVKAKGKRLTNYALDTVKELEPDNDDDAESPEGNGPDTPNDGNDATSEDGATGNEGVSDNNTTEATNTEISVSEVSTLDEEAPVPNPDDEFPEDPPRPYHDETPIQLTLF